MTSFYQEQSPRKSFQFHTQKLIKPSQNSTVALFAEEIDLSMPFLALYKISSGHNLIGKRTPRPQENQTPVNRPPQLFFQKVHFSDTNDDLVRQAQEFLLGFVYYLFLTFSYFAFLFYASVLILTPVRRRYPGGSGQKSRCRS